MQRYFVKGNLQVGEVCQLDTADSHHLLHVMRAKMQTAVMLVDDQQLVYRGELIGVAPTQCAQLAVKETLALPEVELPIQVTIACGLSKHDKLETIVQKATECGMYDFIPLSLKRDVVKWESKKASQKIERLQKIAKEAAEQAQRIQIPQVHEPVTLKQLVTQYADYELKLVAFEEEAKQGVHGQLKSLVAAAKPGSRILVVFGSEGGLDLAEVDHLLANDFHSVSLGPRILRAETAPIYLLSAISYALEL